MSYLYAIVGMLVGAGLLYAYFKTAGKGHLDKIEAENQERIKKAEENVKRVESKAREAETKLKEKILDAKNEALEIVQEAKREEQKMRQQLEKNEERLISKEEKLEERTTEVEKKKEAYLQKEEKLKVREEEVEALYQEQEQKLKEITQLTKEEAQQMLLNNLEREYKDDLVNHYEKIATEAKENVEKESKNILVQAIQKIASDVTNESTQTIVELPGDDIKGRIIGREGRNINAFERLTGVDVIVDDTPGAITISGFDLVRRYIAKRSLQKLIEDGRIHPARIEDVVEQTTGEVDQMMKEFGEKAMFELGFTGIHPELVKIAGRLRFRTSYGQNVLKHCIEVAFVAEQIANLVGTDPYTAKLAGFFHDIGKAVDHEIEGSHALIGEEMAKKYGMSEEVANAIGAHHEEIPRQSLTAFIVQAADAVSAARPGARRETVETYIRRLKDLEKLTNSFEGVEKSYAIQAGREVRLFVNPKQVDDMAAIKMSHEVARKIESELSYPGVIKVQVIRETRATDVAK